jgi:hypothetical protein
MKPAASSYPHAVAIARPDHHAASNLVHAAAALFAAALLLSALSAQAWAHDDGASRHSSLRELETWADGRLVDVQLRVDGEGAPLYTQSGRYDRHYFQAFAGRNYSLTLRNNTGRRVAVLLAVDGLNVLNGEVSGLRSNEPMYVLSPWENATIRGWRSSLDEVRRFVFVDEQRSYAERTGQANSDMGWIRVLSFREQLPWWQKQRAGFRQGSPRLLDDAPRASAPQSLNEQPQARAQESLETSEPKRAKDSAPAPSKSMAPEARGEASLDARDNLAKGEGEGGSFPGTGWGERKQDHVERVQFTPEPVAVDRLNFRYEYASGLHALGIFPERRRGRDRLSERDGDLGFARPPRW